MGSISDAVSFGDFRRARAWMLAMAVSIIGAQLLHQTGVVDLGESMYLSSSLNWLGAILGGLIFGFGMVIASGCPGRNLVRVGGGDLKALVVLIFIGLFGYMAQRGLTAPARSFIQTSSMLDLDGIGIANQHIGTIFSGLLSIAPATAQAVAAAIAVLVLIGFCFKSADFRESPPHIIVGIGLGLLITAGWWVTGVLGNDEFDPVQPISLTFVAPTGNGLQYLMSYTGSTINFGIATVGGAILGAFGSAMPPASSSLVHSSTRKTLSGT